MPDFVNTVKSIFTNKPETVITSALQSTQHIWLIMGAIYVLLHFVYMRVFIGNMADMLINLLVPSQARMFFSPGDLIDMRIGMDFILAPLAQWGSRFAATNALLLFFSLIGGIKLYFTIVKTEVDFVKIGNVVGGASLFYSLFLAAATLLAFVSAYVAIGVLAIGGVAFIVVLYLGMKQVSNMPNSIMWGYLAVYTVATVVSVLLANAMTPSAGDSLLNIIDGFW